MIRSALPPLSLFLSKRGCLAAISHIKALMCLYKSLLAPWMSPLARVSVCVCVCLSVCVCVCVL